MLNSASSLLPDGLANSSRQVDTNSMGHLTGVYTAYQAPGRTSRGTTMAGENPRLTIVALALRQADYMAEQMGQGAIGAAGEGPCPLAVAATRRRSRGRGAPRR